MRNKEYIIQISTGGYLEKQITFQKIQEKLGPVLEEMPVKAVIMGWSTKPDLYIRTRKMLEQYGAELYLWLPVFSETGMLKSAQALTDCRGEKIRSFHLKEGENFEFYCPNIGKNIESFLGIYEEYFSTLPFDGVFLDKIRFASFSNGRSGVFSCFCPVCMEKYKKYGVDTGRLIKEIKKIETGQDGYGRMPLKIQRYKSGIYQFENQIWSSFFEAKSEFIYEALVKVIHYFRKKGLKVGLDTLAPFIAYFTGQNIEKISKEADFIKPMMYRKTQAPAGLPFEYECLVKETVPEKEMGAARERCSSIIGITEKNDHLVPLSFVKKELKEMTAKGSSVFCGIEINRIDKIVPVKEDYITENLEGLEQTDIKGFVLSWDLLSAPGENIDAVIKHIKKQG